MARVDVVKGSDAAAVVKFPGIASHVWSIGEIVGLLDAAEKKAA